MLRFDLDAKQIGNLITELGLTERQAKFALSRALRRTAATLRKLSERGLKSELNLKKMAYLRKRLKSIRFSNSGFEGMRIWYGLNDMPVSTLRGTIKDGGDGASFSGKVGAKAFPGGFVRKSRRGYGRTIMMRKGKARLPVTEARMPVKDQMDVFVEDEIFVQVDEVFWKHFERDMLARAQGFGNKNDRFS